MRILYVWDADYPWDVRVDKICRTLGRAGHEVHIASRNLRRRSTYENVDGVHVHRLHAWPGERINYFFSFPLFCSPIWLRFLSGIVRQSSIDLIIVRDLPLAIGGIWTGAAARIPVILDMAEDYVAMVRDIWRARKFQGLNMIVRNPWLAKQVERYTFRKIDEVLVVVDEAADVVRKEGVPTQNITIVGNTPERDPRNSEESTVALDELEAIKNKFSVVYTGGIQLGRGLQVVFEAIPRIVTRVPNFLFVVIGDGYAGQQLKREIHNRGIDEYVLWLGWKPHQEMLRYIQACRVGVVPHYTSEHVNSTIPNKIFDYMAAGLPVIVSDAPPMRRVVEQEACGRSFCSGDPEALFEALMDVRAREVEFGENGRRAVIERYNWDVDGRRLVSLISKYEK